MKLLDLFEKLTAGVYVKLDNSLYVISNLIEKEFGAYFSKIGGGCLASQMVFSMASVSNIEPNKIIAAINRSKLEGGCKGVKLEDLWKVLNQKKLLIGDEYITFTLSLEAPNIDQAISNVKSGQPVILISNGSFQDSIDDHNRNTGIVKLSTYAIRQVVTSDTYSFHSWLIVGYDQSGDYVILRDSRHRYSFKGYIKVPYAELKVAKKAYKLLTIVVDDMKREKAK